MKKKFIIVLILAFIILKTNTIKAQNYVTIPDTNFVAWLHYYYPLCMNGNQMDTTCSSIKNAVSVNISNGAFSDLTGIEYFINLKNLNCFNNDLPSLPVLPNTLRTLQCYNNLLVNLPVLPDSLQQLVCYNNLLTSIPALPDSLKYFVCHHNQLTTLPALPNLLETFDCSCNLLTSIPALPNALKSLQCSNNQITNIPALPSFLKYFQCFNNLITEIPPLPNTLIDLSCSNNQLTSLPVLSNSITILWCSSNQVTLLPILPDSLQKLYCDNNDISCFPVFPNTIHVNDFNITGNPFTCLPNYINAMDSITLNYPLCVPGDLINNPNECLGSCGFSGYIYKDNNTNCLKDSGDFNLVNVPIKLYDNNNNLLAQMFSFTNGAYNFLQLAGTYKLIIDTVNIPLTIQCTIPGADSIVTTTPFSSQIPDINFNLNCKTEIDIGIQSVVSTGVVFPGFNHMVSIVAGALGQWYNLNCGAGISGQLVVTVTGPVTYIGPAVGALTPLVSGNVFTYNIADFSNINNAQDFKLFFLTNTSAQLGDIICIDAAITSSSGYKNVSNNTIHFCYSVVNSMDPNMKEVFPTSVLPGFDDYFTYTIHFQNTGTAPAYNIRLVDTLSNNLDMETFKVINYSHNNTATLLGNILTFHFPGIMLPDSTTDEPGSKGFVQYKVKPKASLAAGTQLENTAYIYFDYNAPVVTNTTVNEYLEVTLIKENSSSFQIYIYPNPVTDLATLTYTSDKAQYIDISVFDMLGREVMHLNQSVGVGTNSIPINTQVLNKGVYVIKVSNEMHMIKFVKY